MKRWLPALLFAATALVGGLAWIVLAGKTAPDAGRTRTGADARADGSLAERARVDGSTAEGDSSPGAANPAVAANSPRAPEAGAQRVVEAAPLIDVHGWLTISPASDPSRENGHVVLRSVATSPSRVDAKFAVDHGTFDVRLPANAIVRAEEVVLDGKPVTCELQYFDLAKSTWLEVRATTIAPTTLQVIDAVTHRELGDLRLADESGEPIAASRILGDGDPPGAAKPGLASPVTFAAAFQAYRFDARNQERMRIGAPGHATVVVEVEHGTGKPVVVELPIAATLVVELAPWPIEREEEDGDEEPSFGVSLRRIQVPDDEPDPFFAPPRTAPPETRLLSTDVEGQVAYDDLAPGRWAVTVTGSGARWSMPLLDQAIVDVRVGSVQRVTLDLLRARREGARLRVRAHDARDGTPIPINLAQVRVRRLDASFPTRAMELPRPESSHPGPTPAEFGYFWTIAGAVEVTVYAHGEKVWKTAVVETRLAPGENVIDVPLVRAAGLHLIGLRSLNNDDGSTEYDMLSVEVRHRDGRAATLDLTTYFGPDEPSWIFDPGSYQLVYVAAPNDVRVLRDLELKEGETLTIKLTEDDFAKAGVPRGR